MVIIDPVQVGRSRGSDFTQLLAKLLTFWFWTLDDRTDLP